MFLIFLKVHILCRRFNKQFGIVHKKACFFYQEAGFKIISD